VREMNLQTIEMMILLIENFIDLAPWRIVTETLDRLAYGASKSRLTMMKRKNHA
jgi:hypothetical protein